MHRAAILGLLALALLVAACDSEGGGDSTDDPPSATQTTASATVEPWWTKYPSSMYTPTPTPTLGPAVRQEWFAQGYSEGMYNRNVPPDIESAEFEATRYRNPDMPAQTEVLPTGGECLAPEAAQHRTADWLVDLGRFEDEGLLLLTPTFVEEITDHVLLRAKHLASGAEHLYEARRYALFDSKQELEPGELRVYEMRPEFPRAGEWLVLLTHGPNWGCAILDVSESVTRPLVFDIATAEAAGAAFPRRDGMPDRPHPSFSNPSNRGSFERRCYAFGPGDFTQNDQGARSGEWNIQAWYSNFDRWSPTHSGKLPMIPLWQEEMLAPTTRAVREGEPATTMLFQDSEGWAHGGDGGPGHRFFPSPFVFPHEGTWLMVVESEPNWGCYVVDFRVGGISSIWN